jgi:hypothetical protein
VTAMRHAAAWLPGDARLEHALSRALLGVAVGLVALAWPFAEAARFALERLFCRD